MWYAQVEKELLAIVFTCERFDTYIYSRDMVAVETDHKPLKVLVRKALNSAPQRLQGKLLPLQRNNLEITFVCIYTRKARRCFLLTPSAEPSYLKCMCLCWDRGNRPQSFTSCQRNLMTNWVCLSGWSSIPGTVIDYTMWLVVEQSWCFSVPVSLFWHSRWASPSGQIGF